LHIFENFLESIIIININAVILNYLIRNLKLIRYILLSLDDNFLHFPFILSHLHWDQLIFGYHTCIHKYINANPSPPSVWVSGVTTGYKIKAPRSENFRFASTVEQVAFAPPSPPECFSCFSGSRNGWSSESLCVKHLESATWKEWDSSK